MDQAAKIIAQTKTDEIAATRAADDHRQRLARLVRAGLRAEAKLVAAQAREYGGESIAKYRRLFGKMGLSRSDERLDLLRTRERQKEDHLSPRVGGVLQNDQLRVPIARRQPQATTDPGEALRCHSSQMRLE